MNKQEEVKFTQSGFLKIDGKKRVSVRFERGSDEVILQRACFRREKSQRIMDFPIRK